MSTQIRDLDVIRDTDEPLGYVAGPNRWTQPNQKAGEPRVASTTSMPPIRPRQCQ